MRLRKPFGAGRDLVGLVQGVDEVDDGLREELGDFDEPATTHHL